MEKRYQIIVATLIACLMFLLVLLSLIYLSLLDEAKTIENEKQELNETKQEEAEDRVKLKHGYY
jgi:cell division protein FtsB